MEWIYAIQNCRARRFVTSALELSSWHSSPFQLPLFCSSLPSLFLVLAMLLSIITQTHFLVLLCTIRSYIASPTHNITDQQGYEPHCLAIYIRILLVLFIDILFSSSLSSSLSYTNVFCSFSSSVKQLLFSSAVISSPDIPFSDVI